ncbi:MAG: hypothetical protein Kow00100_06070 [Geothermobacteraceae bacterium]
MRNLLLLLLTLLAWSEFASAAVVYQGEQTLWQDTVWQGEVVIDGILTVAPEARLEIRPGTRVLFRFVDSNNDGLGESDLFVQGRLLALGTADAPIHFASELPDQRPGLWGAVNVMGSDQSNRLQYCLIEGASIAFHSHFGRAELDHCLFRANLRALMFQDSTVTLAFSRIENNRNGLQFRDATVLLRNSIVRDGFWAVRGTYSQVEMVGCLVENNRVNGVNLRDSTLTARGNMIRGNRSGFYVQGGQAELTGNHILDNSEHGTLLEQAQVQVHRNRLRGNGRSAVRWIDSTGDLAENDLAGNGEYALINDGGTDLVVGANWWGGSDPDLTRRLVRDQADRAGRGAVTFAAPLHHAPDTGSWRLPRTP